MRSRGGLGALLALAGLGGLLLMGAAPAPGSPPLPVDPRQGRAAAMARMLPTPRLYEITNTIDGEVGGTAQWCVSADSMARQLDPARERPRTPAAGPRPGLQGCTHRFELKPGGGGMHSEMSCDRAAGAARTYRATTDTDGHFGMRQHMAAQVDGPRGPRTRIMDTRIVQAGACPADLKPGEMRMADGKKVDAAARLAGLTGGGGATGVKPGAAK